MHQESLYMLTFPVHRLGRHTLGVYKLYELLDRIEVGFDDLCGTVLGRGGGP